jgi:hypothetical protein
LQLKPGRSSSVSQVIFSTSPTDGWRRPTTSVDDFSLNVSLFLPVPVLTRTHGGRLDRQRTWGEFLHHGRWQNSVLPFEFFDAFPPLFADVLGEADETGNVLLVR